MHLTLLEPTSTHVLRILRPERFEMNCQTDLSSTVHFGRLPFEFRDLDFRRDEGISGRDIELKLEFISNELMYIPSPSPYKTVGIGRFASPAFSRPMGAVFAWTDGKPVRITLFVHVDILNQR